ncbi:hypothetical protein HZB78_05500 [Candidatus Collierbacteria bacterium]|nr:hypothetical protein [Candidatus Collierbacteria bacterium]
MSLDTKAVINPNTGEIKSVFNVEREPLLCPVCGIEVEYLVGDDLTGGRRGCESCWRPPTPRPEGVTPDKPAQPPPAPVSSNQLADFDREVKQEYGQASPPMPGVLSSQPPAPDSDFQQFRQNLAEKAKAMDGGDTNG